MYFSIEYSTSTASFEHTIRTEDSDLKAVFTGITAFLDTVTEEVHTTEEIDQVRENLHSAVDETIEEMQTDG